MSPKKAATARDEAELKQRADLRDGARVLAGRLGHKLGRFTNPVKGDTTQQAATCENDGCRVGVTVAYAGEGRDPGATWWLEGEPRVEGGELWALPPCPTDAIAPMAVPDVAPAPKKKAAPPATRAPEKVAPPSTASRAPAAARKATARSGRRRAEPAAAVDAPRADPAPPVPKRVIRDFGIALTPSPDSWKVVQRAEELGFSHAWFYDSQLLYTDVFVSMALAAEHTRKIRIGTGVLVPSNRIAPVAANALASLNQLAPGRVVFGVGTGFTARNTMGMPAQTLADVREYVRVVQAMLGGDTVEFEFEGKTRKVRFLDPANGMLNVKDRVPLHVSAFGPRGKAFAAEAGDGWMTFLGTAEQASAEAAALDEACAAAGRDPASLYRTAFTLGCVLKKGEAADGPRAMAQAGPFAAVGWHARMERFGAQGSKPVPDAFREVYEGYEPEDARYLELHRGHLLYVRDDERQFVSESAIRRGTLTGTREEIRERVEGLGAAGFDQVAIQLVHGHEKAIDDWAKVFGLG